MLYQIRYLTATGIEGTKGIVAESDESALEQFQAEWNEFPGDPLLSCEVVERWATWTK